MEQDLTLKSEGMILDQIGEDGTKWKYKVLEVKVEAGTIKFHLSYGNNFDIPLGWYTKEQIESKFPIDPKEISSAITSKEAGKSFEV